MDFIDLKTQYRRLKPVIDERMMRVLAHGQYILGPECRAFEQEFAAYLAVKHAVLTSSATAALWMGLKACGVKAGDEVLVLVLGGVGGFHPRAGRGQQDDRRDEPRGARTHGRS